MMFTSRVVRTLGRTTTRYHSSSILAPSSSWSLSSQSITIDNNNKNKLFSTKSSNVSSDHRNVVVVSGVRIPFAMSSTIYDDQLAVDLQRHAICGLLTQTALDKDVVDYVIMGNVVQEVRTSNIAREAAIQAGLSSSIGAHTVAQACISASAAICNGAEKILTGHADVVLAGGVETFSDTPIRLKRPIRQKLITMNKAMKKGGTVGAMRHMMKGITMKDVGIETPAIANYTTGEVMGVSSDRLSATFGISRQEQDEYTVRSHTLAASAHANGFYKNEVVAYKGSTMENGIKGDSTIESVSKLKPAFNKSTGTHTAANSSYLTDGAAVTLLMEEKRALELGYTPLAYLRDWSFRACDPFEELLLGPTYCSQEVLSKTGLSMNDMGVIEIHEAFAGQILSNLTAMKSQQFADKNFHGSIVGDIDITKMNTKGGSLSLGHPFGATGSRLVTTASRRLQQEQQQYALIAACADGGLGHACILERYDG